MKALSAMIIVLAIQTTATEIIDDSEQRVKFSKEFFDENNLIDSEFIRPTQQTTGTNQQLDE